MNLLERFRRGSSARTAAREDREFLPAHLEIIDTPASPLGRLFGLAIILLFVGAVTWACLGRVDVIATAHGHILPLGDIKTIQPLDPAVVAAIDVQDGQHVRAGQTLIEFDATQPNADRDRLARDLVLADLSVARLEALAGAVRSGARPTLTLPPAAPADLAADARLATEAQYDEYINKIEGLTEQIAEKQAEIDECAAQINKLRATLIVLEDKAEVHQQLTARGFGTKLAYLDAQQQVIEARQEILVQNRRGIEVAAAKRALERGRTEAKATYISDLLESLRKARAEENELKNELIKMRNKSEETRLTSPIDGVVAQLAVHTLNGVVTPAQRLMIIVPEHGQLIVQAQLANSDVGFVHPGQPAKIKIETFNFTRYGLLDGRVMDVSSDAQYSDGRPVSDNLPSTQQGAPTATSASYLARISISRPSMTVDGVVKALQPGMAATVEIKTGRRSIMSYLLSPIARVTAESIHER